MWQIAKVKLMFENRLCGSIPLKKEIVGPWLKARMPKEKPPDGRSIEEIKAEVLESIEDIQERMTLGFQSNEVGLFVRGGTIKAHLKDCANQIKDTFKPEIKALRSKIANKVYIEEYAVHLLKSGQPTMKPDGEVELSVHAMSLRGPINTLKIVQYLLTPSMEFTFRLLIDKEITKEVVAKIFEYGTIHGYAGERGMGEGRYKFEIEWQ